jgi:hypothetical protein
MRNRKYLIAAVVGVIGALGVAGVASSAVLTQTETSTVSPSKLPAKTFKGATQHNIIATTIDNPATTAPPQKTVFTFPSDVKFVPGNLPACALSQITGKTPDAAAAACSGSVVGQGTVEANNGAVSGGVKLISGGPTTLYVATNPGGANLVLTGTFAGRTLTFDNLPKTTGIILTKFDTSFNKVKTGGKTFYFMARCGKKKKLVVSETTTFYDGVSKTASSTQNCKQTK